MDLLGSALSLTVDDVSASSTFFSTHFGFTPTVAVEQFAKLTHPTAGFELCFMQRGIDALPEDVRDRRAEGLIVAFVVRDAASEEARLRSAGVPITLPMRDEEWGERLFQVQDPNGVTVQLVEWLAAPGG